MLGVVDLDKPVGPSSHDMVGLLRRLTGTRRIGHAGTLDPLASGVLPVLIGPATRFSEELSGGSKRYDAVIRLGQRSATDDAEGPLEPGHAPLPEPKAVAIALREFVGTFAQRPPAFSARKAAGQRAYRLARSGAPVDLPPRQVTVHAIELLGTVPGADVLDVRVDITCGAGTYIRSIARDLGERLGCGGHVYALRRTEAAGLRIEDAFTPERLVQLAAEGRLDEAVLDVGTLLPLPRLALNETDAARFVRGSALRLGGVNADGPHAIYRDAELLGVGRLHAGLLRPEKVVSMAEAGR
jgi:tRNA pseudouridine55 synthase